MTIARITLAAVLICAALARAQQPGVKLILPTNTSEVGEVINAQLVCNNVGTPAVPNLPAQDGVTLLLVSETPFLSQRHSIINGKRSSKVTHTFNLRVVGTKPGTYVIGPISVQADGRQFTTRGQTLRVRETIRATGPRGDQLLFVELNVQPRQLYVTETYSATLTIGIRKVVLNGREYELDMLRQVLDLAASEISIFAGGQANRSERWLEDSQGRRHKYEIYRVTRRRQAEQRGSIEIGPVFLKADYPTAVRRGFFGRPEISRTRKETALADAVKLRVLDPPADARPADFTGAIGQYTLTAHVKPDRVELGQPVTLTVSIKGSPIESIAGPNLSTNAELSSRFDFTQDELVGDIESGAKVFRRALFPRQVGEQTVPSINWSYFDTRREQYVSVQSDPITIRVDPPSQPDAGLPPFDLSEQKRDATSLTLVSGGIAPNYVDAAKVLGDNSTALMTPTAASALVVPPLACLGVTLTWRRRRRLNSDTGYARSRRAAAKALAAVKRALSERQAADQLGGVARALSTFISDRFNVTQTSVTPAECTDTLRERGFNKELVRSITQFLQRCDALRYAPSAAESMSPRDAARSVRSWIRQLDRGAR